jgi:hypothetical protein
MKTVYDAAGGLDGLRKLASAWHIRMLQDEVVSHAFSHGFHPQHTERLAAYHDGSLSPLGGGCAGWFADPEVVLGRPRQWRTD